MKYQIITTDLDGTLLNGDGTVSSENWEAIKKLQALGVYVVPTTGRAFTELPDCLLDSPFFRYYITSDGADVYDKQTCKSYPLALSQALVNVVLDKLYNYPVTIFLHTDHKSFVDESSHNIPHYQSFHMNSYWIEFAMEYEVPVSDLKAFAYTSPSVESFCVFFKNMEDLLECKAFFEKDPRLQVAQTDPYNLEIFSASAGKGNALRLLTEVLGATIDAVIAVGDSTNDMTMLTAAGLGLAMSNAVPELKAAADAVICSNEEHAIRYILEHYC